jgi:hypothetical protein
MSEFDYGLMTRAEFKELCRLTANAFRYVDGKKEFLKWNPDSMTFPITGEKIILLDTEEEVKAAAERLKSLGFRVGVLPTFSPESLANIRASEQTRNPA